MDMGQEVGVGSNMWNWPPEGALELSSVLPLVNGENLGESFCLSWSSFYHQVNELDCTDMEGFFQL